MGPEAAEDPASTGPAEPRRDQTPPQRRSLADLLEQPVDSAPRWIANLPRRQVDDARAAAAGIRKLSGKRLTLYTDMPSDSEQMDKGEIEQLPGLFDQAFPQWCKYFHVDAAKHADWKMTGFLMKDKARFRRTGLLPDGLPPFRHGYSQNHELWLYDQPSDYYRRHLLLHEGTHGFMNAMLGGCGPPWYMEGMAELLATHRWHGGRLTLNHIPAVRREVPHWGRIRIIKDATAAGRPMRLKDVIEYPIHAHLETEPYAWCWAAATLLDRHPRYRDRFRQLYKHVLKPDLSDRFYRLVGDDWEQLREEWQLLVTGLEYGHDVPRTAVDFAPGKALPPGGAGVTVAADRGWQNSRLRLEADAKYRLQAAGRYQVAKVPKIWWCEPGGVSIRYYQGCPLGVLLAAVRPDQGTRGSSELLRPTVVGLATTLSPKESGTLYLRINDSAAELDDNAGELRVEIRRVD
ncbi:MAG: hypothetical protein ACYSWU_16265 [Planctomycetota bacterium]|jgi:hypothetical protein